MHGERERVPDPKWKGKWEGEGSPKFNGRTAEIFRERKKEEERCLILLFLFYNKKFRNFLLTRTQGLGYNLQLRSLPRL